MDRAGFIRNVGGYIHNVLPTSTEVGFGASLDVSKPR